MANQAPKDDLTTAEVTPTSTDEEAPSNESEGSLDNVSNHGDKPEEEKESCGWRVYYWVGMLSAFGLGAIIMFAVMKSRESSTSPSKAIPEAPIVNDEDVSNPTDVSGLPQLQESKDFPLQLCFGDCDTDADCDLNLRCFQRDPNEAVPGCEGGLDDESRTDFCVPIVLPEVEETNNFPLGLCQGDCDTADDCEAGLVCFQRSANDEVPGCLGSKLDSSNTDYCIPEETEGFFLKKLGQRLLGGKGDSFGFSTSLSRDGSTLAVGAIDAGSAGYVALYQLIDAKSWKFVTKIEGDNIGSEFGHSVSLSGDGNFLAVGVPKAPSGYIRNVGKVLVYELLLNEFGTKWNIVGEIESDNPNIGTYLGFEFGQSVALSSDGSVLAVGEPLDGRITLFRSFNGTWPKIGNSIQLADLAGRSLSLSDDGSRIAISGETQGGIFDFDGSDWAQSTPTQATDNIFQDGGTSIVLSGDGSTVAIGRVDNGVGEIVIQTFQYPVDSVWNALGVPVRLISGDSTVPNIVLSQDGRVLVVGDPHFDGVGRIALFSFDESMNEWQQTDSVVGRAFNEMFGVSLAIAQDATGSTKVAIGSPYPVQMIGSFGSAVVYKIEYGEKAAETSAPTVAPTTSSPAIFEQVDSWKGLQGETAGKDVDISKNGRVLAYSVTQIGSSGYVESFQRNDETSEWERMQRLDETGVNFGHSISLSSDGKVIAVGIPGGNTVDGNISGRVRVYSLNETVSEWIQIGNDIASEPFDPNASFGGDGFGHSVSLSSSGNIVAIGSPYGTSHTVVYRLEGGAWRMRGDKIRYSVSPALEGWSVSISDDGNMVAVGAPTNEEVSDEAGVCIIYEYIDGSWQRRGQPLFGDAQHDVFGTSVSLSGDGDIVSVGSINNDNENGEDAGHVRVYRFNRSTDIWERLGQPILGAANSDRFGVSISLSNDGMTIAVGARGHGLGGQVQLFQFDEKNTMWKQLGPAMNGNVENGAFGAAVSLSEAAEEFTLAVGAPDTMDETLLGLVRDPIGEVFLYEGVNA
ncbi:unnamed protein product [Cylindrotheca closterium]|uniref:Uncharacterized protein n=1 Tax=Cylindrotheca closterium TaxID=2856 RepID=A0AAD2FK32_9STRA|nr:unnamed protein product [Cylindrotheca closterium]